MKPKEIKKASKGHFAELPDGYVESVDALNHVAVVDDDSVKASFELYSDDTRPDAPYVKINTALWSGEPVPAEFAEHVDNIQNYIEQHPIEKGIRVYRGVDQCYFDDFIDAVDIDGMEADDGLAFTSTSVTKNVAQEFADKKAAGGLKVVQVLDVPKGHPAINLRGVSKYEDEDEIVLPIGTKTIASGKMESEGYLYLYFKVQPWGPKKT